jgi:hypothetical protein
MFILSVSCSCSTSNSAEMSQQPVAKLPHIKFNQLLVRGSRVIACVQMESQNIVEVHKHIFAPFLYERHDVLHILLTRHCSVHRFTFLLKSSYI